MPAGPSNLFKEVAPQDHDEMTKHAQQYLSAHGKQLARKKIELDITRDLLAAQVKLTLKQRIMGNSSALFAIKRFTKLLSVILLRKQKGNVIIVVA